MENVQNKIMVSVLGALMFFLFSAPLCFATVCSGLEVISAGAKSHENAVFVKRTASSSSCPGFDANVGGDGMWVVLDPANSDAMLAGALTALSLGTTVTIVNVSGDFVNQGTIIELYVAK